MFRDLNFITFPLNIPSFYVIILFGKVTKFTPQGNKYLLKPKLTSKNRIKIKSVAILEYRPMKQLWNKIWYKNIQF